MLQERDRRKQHASQKVLEAQQVQRAKSIVRRQSMVRGAPYIYIYIFIIYMYMYMCVCMYISLWLLAHMLFKVPCYCNLFGKEV